MEQSSRAVEGPLDVTVGRRHECVGWLPINTAPRDGTDVLVLLDSEGVSVVHIAWYRGPEEWESSGQYCGGWDTLEDWKGWWSYTRNSLTQERLEGPDSPTHWMRLPPAPNDGNEGLPKAVPLD